MAATLSVWLQMPRHSIPGIRQLRPPFSSSKVRLQLGSELVRWATTALKFSSRASSQRSSSLSSASFSMTETKYKLICYTPYISRLSEPYLESHGEEEKAQRAPQSEIGRMPAAEGELEERVAGGGRRTADGGGGY